MEGRLFNAGDTPETQPVVIIDQRLAALYWPDASALGKRLQLNPQIDRTWYTVVGVSTPAIQEEELDVGQVSRPVIYRPTSQYIPDSIQALVKVNSTQIIPASLFREVATKVDRDIPISDLITLRELEIDNLERNKFDRNLFVAFIFIALFITGVATYGLAARMAGRRRIETGIRMALGASRSAAMQVFIKDGFRIVATGLSLGTVAAIGGSYMILVDVNFAGTFTLLIPFTLIISLVLGILVMLANYLPARKLVDLEPAEALRYE
jgi:ABC-type antimicrobial peptide transport system permease subunit